MEFSQYDLKAYWCVKVSLCQVTLYWSITSLRLSEGKQRLSWLHCIKSLKQPNLGGYVVTKALGYLQIHRLRKTKIIRALFWMIYFSSIVKWLKKLIYTYRCYNHCNSQKDGEKVPRVSLLLPICKAVFIKIVRIEKVIYPIEILTAGSIYNIMQ